MNSEGRTFHKAMTLSIAAHIAIFGSALAFAQYAGGVFRSAGAVISVSLVGGGGGSVKGPGEVTTRRMPVSERTPALPVHESAPASNEGTKTGEDAAAPADGENAGTAAGQGQGEGAGPAEENGTGNGSGAFSLEQWSQLSSAIEKAKTYPRFARERGIEGTVLVRFKVLPSGTVETVTVVKSSGAAILDDASVRTVYRAAPMPFVNGWVEVPLSYVLK